MARPRVIEVLPFLNIVEVWNLGVSFGLLASNSSLGRWFLIVLALVITGFLLAWLWRLTELWPAMAIGLVIGGALGNVLDRLWLGAVYDFIDLHITGYHWPAFNLADSAITIGVVILVADALFVRRPESM
jgi:signal peptidase II